MKIISAALCVLALAAGATGAAKADTPLDGTFNGSFSCPKFQGTTNAFLTFVVSKARARAIMTIYDSQSSKYAFATSIVSYSGFYDATTRKFALTGLKEIGQEPQGWNYDGGIKGTVSADGSQIVMTGNAYCAGLTATRVTLTSTIKN